MLSFESMDLPADGLTVVAYGAEPGSDSEDGLRLLASWATSPVATPRPLSRGA